MTLAHGTTLGIPSGILFKSYLVGVRFDFRVISIILLPLFLLSTLPGIDISRSKITRRIGLAYISVMTAFMFLLHMVEIEFFLFFNTRLNGSALMWFDTPGDTFAMIWSSYPVLPYVLLYVTLTIAFILTVRAYLGWVVRRIGTLSLPVNLAWIPIVLVVFVMGGIGRIYKNAPMRWGIGYFSEYNFANQLSLNPTVTFMRDVFYDAHKRAQVKKLVDRWHQDGGKELVRTMLDAPASPDSAGVSQRLLRRIHFDKQNPDPPNILLIMMESFGSTKIGCLLNEYPYDLSPGFDSLVKSGILFTRFYTSATHTGPGLFNIMTGTPHIFAKVMFKQVEGHTSYNALPEILRQVPGTGRSFSPRRIRNTTTCRDF